MQKDNKFSYTYSAPTAEERREIESIRRQYKQEIKEENKVEYLRKLHSKVVGTATAVSLCVGVGGTLVFGLGMALAIELDRMILGIIISAVGLPAIAAALPLYKRVMESGRKKYGAEIIRLSDELLGEENHK